MYVLAWWEVMERVPGEEGWCGLGSLVKGCRLHHRPLQVQDGACFAGRGDRQPGQLPRYGAVLELICFCAGGPAPVPGRLAQQDGPAGEHLGAEARGARGPQGEVSEPGLDSGEGRGWCLGPSCARTCWHFL